MDELQDILGFRHKVDSITLARKRANAIMNPPKKFVAISGRIVRNRKSVKPCSLEPNQYFYSMHCESCETYCTSNGTICIHKVLDENA